MADHMAAETLRALIWTLTHAPSFGGDASRVSVMGHSAGGHLGALAVMMLAVLRQQEEAVARGADAGQRRAAAGGGRQQAASMLALPRVQLFLGMSGVYHVSRHHEFEMSR
jgi:carboxylesterase type B